MLRRVLGWFTASIVASLAACSAGDQSASIAHGHGADAGAGASGGAAGAGGGGADATGGSGGGLFDASQENAGGAPPLDDACAATSAASAPVTLPADIVWVVDQSGSMNQETAYVQQKINDFATLIDQSGIDYHVVMIASPTGGNSICVPPPLGGPNCGDNTRFKLVDQHVESNDALDQIVNHYPDYASFLRIDATKHFVVVSDDNATDAPINSAAAFMSALAGMQPPGMFASWKFHGIYAFGTVPFIGCIGPFGTGAAVGQVYTDLIAQTGGASGVICTGDWTQVFADITTAVVQGAKVSCEYAIPDSDAGTLDPTKVNVDYYAGGAPPAQLILQVDDATQCNTGGNTGGWYYDDNQNPTKILLCPGTCAAVQADPTAKIDVEFGCETHHKPVN